MTMYYGTLNKSGAEANVPYWELQKRPDLILMEGPPPSGMATANADGTWSNPVSELRKAAYINEADPLYMDWQAAVAEGKPESETDVLKTAWLTKRNEIKSRF